MSLPLLVLYGLGTTIGAGIYALIGKVAGSAGIYAPVSFLVAALIAALSALSFAELGARFPVSAGEARYVREAFGSALLSTVVGFMVVAAGVLAAAAIANGFAGYLHDLTGAPRLVGVGGLVLALGALAAWGIRESALAAGAMTLIEIGGLVLVIWAGGGAPTEAPPRLAELVPPVQAAAWSGIFVGSFLAFFAFIGFEDMANVAEEVKDVTRALPRAIVLTLAITLPLYIALAVVVVRTVPIAELAASEAPLALVFAWTTGWPTAPISVIGVIATVNGALIQIVMAARVFYGLARQGQLPAALSRVHPMRRTPLLATALVTGAILALALPFRIVPLAEATSLIVLSVFALVNLALWRIKRLRPVAPGALAVPLWVPIAGFAVSASFVAIEAIRLAPI